MARRSISLSAGGGLFRSVERLGISRGVFGGSRGWFYVGTGLWTVRKVRTLARREPEILLREELRPGGRITIANGVATIENMPLEDRHLGVDHLHPGLAHAVRGQIHGSGRTR